MTQYEIDQMIYDAAISEGFNPTTAKYVVAQSRLETGHYTSDVFKLNNNLFGMKFVGQPLATRGTLAPPSERSSNCRINNVCVDSDHYAQYPTPKESALDTIQRNYNLTRSGITPDMLKNSSSPEEFAHLLKVRGYYGGSESDYAYNIRSISLRVSVVDFYYQNKKKIDFALIGGILIGLTAYGYFLYKKGVFNKK